MRLLSSGIRCIMKLKEIEADNTLDAQKKRAWKLAAVMARDMMMDSIIRKSRTYSAETNAFKEAHGIDDDDDDDDDDNNQSGSVSPPPKE